MRAQLSAAEQRAASASITAASAKDQADRMAQRVEQAETALALQAAASKRQIEVCEQK